ncbi:MAG: hypothetical protein IPN46_00015 [Saprospiraceae bacterium]|nr:hypothetical protein [Saprospiraceae bacterium]
MMPLICGVMKTNQSFVAFVQISRNKNFATGCFPDICHLANVDTAAIQAMVKDIYNIKTNCKSHKKHRAHQPENDTSKSPT